MSWVLTLMHSSFRLKSVDIHKENTFHDIEIPILAIVFHNDGALAPQEYYNFDLLFEHRVYVWHTKWIYSGELKVKKSY